MIKEGLQITPEDERDFNLGAYFSLPPIEELPPVFILETLKVKNQLDSDFCAAFAFTTISELQEGVELSPEWQFAVAKKISGNKSKWGSDLRSMMKGGKKHGSVEQINAPFSLRDKDKKFLRDINNWPKDLFQKAAFHKKESFFKVTGPYDHYDNIRASMWKFREKKRGVITGLKWHWRSSDYILEGASDQGFGHALAIKGWTPEGLIIQNSVGIKAGKGGDHILKRDVVNHNVDIYKAFMNVDLSPEDALYYLENGIKEGDNWIIEILKVVWTAVLPNRER